MKHFTDYILEKRSLNNVSILEDVNGNIIVEGFWKKLGSLFGFGTGKIQKLSDKMEKWSDDFKNAFTISQYMAAQSKNDNMAKLMAEYVNAIDKGGDAPLKFLKERAQEIKDKPELLKDNNVAQVYLGFMKNLAELSKNAKDEEGIDLSKEGAGVIGKQNSDIKKEYEQTSKKVEKVEDGPTEADAEGGKEEKKNPEEVTAETIKDNADVLTPIVKTLGGKVDGNKLKDTVTKLLSKTQKTAPMKLKQNNILGMSIMICGALMMSSDKGLKAVCNELETDAKTFTDAIKPDEIKTGDKK